MIPRVLELRSIQPKAYQPHPKGEQFVVTLRLAHDGAALGDGLGRYGKAQIHISGSPARMESGVKTALSALFHSCCRSSQFLIHCPDAAANGLDHSNGDAVSGLLVGLGI